MTIVSSMSVPALKTVGASALSPHRKRWNMVDPELELSFPKNCIVRPPKLPHRQRSVDAPEQDLLAIGTPRASNRSGPRTRGVRSVAKAPMCPEFHDDPNNEGDDHEEEDQGVEHLPRFILVPTSPCSAPVIRPHTSSYNGLDLLPRKNVSDHGLRAFKSIPRPPKLPCRQRTLEVDQDDGAELPHMLPKMERAQTGAF